MKATENNNGTKVMNANNVIDMVIENGIDFGTPHIKSMNTVRISEDGSCTTERNLFISGYKFRMDDIMRYSIKRYVMENAPKYKSAKDIDKTLTEKINYKIGGDAPQCLKIRTKQLTVLVRGLIKALRFSKNIKKELNLIFGDTQCDKVLADVPFNGIVNQWKSEWKKDYSNTKYKFQ